MKKLFDRLLIFIILSLHVYGVEYVLSVQYLSAVSHAGRDSRPAGWCVAKYVLYCTASIHSSSNWREEP